MAVNSYDRMNLLPDWDFVDFYDKFKFMKYERRILKNGLRAIAVPMKNTETVTLLVLVGTGSRYETKNINGISHFLEHLFFKGTKSRPKPGQIHRALDRIGAEHNAFTSKELTGFWVKSSYSDFDVSLDIISDILLEPIFKKEEIEKERGVIFQEKSMYEDLPSRKAAVILENVLYGDTPLGRDIIGTDESIKKIERSEIINYLKGHYSGSNAVVTVAGNIDAKTAFSKIECAFTRITKGKTNLFKKAKDFQKIPQIKLIEKKTDQMHLAVGLRAYDNFDERKYALSLLATILGGNFSSRLWMEIREKLGLAYYVGAEGEQYSDVGYLGIRAGIPHEKLAKVLEKIVETLKKIKQKGVSDKELKDAKSFTRGHLALSLESSDEVATFYGEQELLLKKILRPEEILKRIEKISKRDILRIGKDIFRSSKINVVAIGQHPNVKEQTRLYTRIFNKI
jgi:predicted Zn-dependent peptidase